MECFVCSFLCLFTYINIWVEQVQYFIVMVAKS